MGASSCGVAGQVAEAAGRAAAFYGTARKGGWRDWWTILHPPYTAWHLSYVVIGAVLAPHPSVSTLVALLVAFFLAVGVAAHGFDELHGRPLGTLVPARTLAGVSGIALVGAAAIGVAGMSRDGAVLVPLVAAGAFIVVAYNLELFEGRFHHDLVFAAAWGAFPVLTAYVAETRSLSLSAVLAAAACFALSAAQRALSGPARLIRRSVSDVDGVMVMSDGTRRAIDEATLLRPIEAALKALSWGVVAFALALALDRLT